MPVIRWLRRRRALKQMIDAEASGLVEREGKRGHFIAREIARMARSRGDSDAWRLWSRVSRDVARRTGYVVGWSKIGRDG